MPVQLCFLLPGDPGSTWLIFGKINRNLSEGPAITEAIFCDDFSVVYQVMPTPEISFVFDAQLVMAVRTLEPSNITPKGVYTYLQGVPHIRSLHDSLQFSPRVCVLRYHGACSENEVICDQQSVPSRFHAVGVYTL